MLFQRMCAKRPSPCVPNAPPRELGEELDGVPVWDPDQASLLLSHVSDTMPSLPIP